MCQLQLCVCVLLLVCCRPESVLAIQCQKGVFSASRYSAPPTFLADAIIQLVLHPGKSHGVLLLLIVLYSFFYLLGGLPRGLVDSVDVFSVD